MPLGEGRIVDADVGIGGAADQARRLEGETAAVILAADAAQHHARIARRIERRVLDRDAGTGSIARPETSSISTPST